jgi:hypothetical protein
MLRAGNYFGLDCGLLGFFFQIFYSRAVLQRSVADFSAIFGDRFDGKDGGLCTYNPHVEEVGGLEVFLYLLSGSELSILVKNSRSKLKKRKPIAV